MDQQSRFSYLVYYRFSTSSIHCSLINHINKLHDPVTKVRRTATGKVIVHCNSKDVIDDVKKKLTRAMKANVNVSEPKALQPRIRILAVDAGYVNASISVSDDDDCAINDDDGDVVGDTHDYTELINTIRRQNENVIDVNSNLKVVEAKLRKDGKYNIVLDCDIGTLNKILERPRSKIGWDICYVHEYLNLFRCYHCNKFSDHNATSCPLKDESPFCPRCSQRHSVELCQVKDRKDLCCNNCKEFNARNQTNVPTNHTVWSSMCPILQRIYKQQRERIRYAS